MFFSMIFADVHALGPERRPDALDGGAPVLPADPGDPRVPAHGHSDGATRELFEASFSEGLEVVVVR